MALFGKKTPAKVKKTAPPPAKAAKDVPSPAPVAGAVAAAHDTNLPPPDNNLPDTEVIARMGNAPRGATPESHPEKFDIFGNPL